jgi:hypothetical protein
MVRNWVGIPSDRVVAVVASLHAGQVQIGSGYLVNERLVLTALHCAVDKRTGQPAMRLRVAGRTDGVQAPATLLASVPDLDVAVLAVEDSPWSMADAPELPQYGRVDRAHSGELRDCQAMGFPLWQLDPKDQGRNSAELHGTIRVTEDAESGFLVMRDPYLESIAIPATVAAEDRAATSAWGGLSGALVFYRGMALGVIAEHHPRQGGSAVRIVPVEGIVAAAAHGGSSAAAMAEALGLPPAGTLPLANPALPPDIVIARRREEARFWCRQVLGNAGVDFWSPDRRQQLYSAIDSFRPLALTAMSGGGKSVHAAHAVNYLLDSDESNCPVIVTPKALGGGPRALCELAGARSWDWLVRYAEGMRQSGQHLLFIIDALDRTTGTISTEEITTILRKLADASCLLVTCRTEFWEQFSRIGIEEARLQPLGQDIVRGVLSQNTRLTQGHLAVLKIPFYLDAALTVGQSYIELPVTETELLQALWNIYRQRPGSAMPQWPSFEPLLTGLAKLQLDEMSYEVRRSALVANLEMVRGAEATARLEDDGILMRRTAGNEDFVRLRHDLLDCYNMARLIIHGPEAPQRRAILYERAAEGVGWPLLSMLVQVAHDRSNTVILHELFDEILRVNDRKRWDDRWMARCWAATYFMRDKITILLPLILECLDGERVPSLQDATTPGGSRLGPQARVTQEAASSLASAISALSDWREGNPSRAIPVLRRGLDRWHLRKRFIEALATYKDPAALAALISFTSNQLRPGGDLGVLSEAAEALGRLGEALGADDRQACLELLDEIIAHPGLDLRARRSAIESRNHLTSSRHQVIPEADENEIITYLNPIDEERQSYSDWRVVQHYADLAYRRIAAGYLSRPLLDALLRALTHDHTFARIPVAHCLGQIDDPAARTALLQELAGSSVPADVQQACVEAFDAQIRGAAGPALRALRRWMALDASSQARRSSGPVARVLADLASTSGGAEENLVTLGAFEILHPASASGQPAFSIEFSSAGAVSVPGWIRDLVEPDDLARAGEGRERKFHLVSVSSPMPAELHATIAETTWEEGASFHSAMSRQGASLRQIADRILSAWLKGTVDLPGILSVHCIVLTRDQKVVATRRASGSFYSANLWSVSFEEQVTSSDFETSDRDAVIAAAKRGFSEELGLSAEGCRVHVVSSILELPILSPALVAIIETDETSEGFKHAWEAAGNSYDAEIAEFNFVDATAVSLQSEIRRADLHPTSAIRMQMLSRRLAHGS